MSLNEKTVEKLIKQDTAKLKTFIKQPLDVSQSAARRDRVIPGHRPTPHQTHSRRSCKKDAEERYKSSPFSALDTIPSSPNPH